VHLGSSYPVTDLGTDPAVVRTFAVGLEELGFDELYVSDHILGVDTASQESWSPYNPTTREMTGPLYDHTFAFLEPMVTFGYLAGITSRIRLVSSVMVLGMRQAVLVAKQTAVADVLSGGRITLGVGVGWNDLEYRAMGVDFSSRGSRVEEQLEVMRALWTKELVTFEGRWHHIPAAGINPLPIQRPIPIWIGGVSDKATARAARLADGWYPGQLLEAEAPGEPYVLSKWGADSLDLFRSSATAAGRDPGSVAFVGAVNVGPRSPQMAADEIAGWARIGATHVNIRTSLYPRTWSGESTAQTARVEVDRHLEMLASIAACWRDRAIT
jgi:probable F420-dependent oxidoreductase